MVRGEENRVKEVEINQKQGRYHTRRASTTGGEKIPRTGRTKGAEAKQKKSERKPRMARPCGSKYLRAPSVEEPCLRKAQKEKGRDGKANLGSRKGAAEKGCYLIQSVKA